MIQIITPTTFVVTLASGQGPRAVSTLEAQQAALEAQAFAEIAQSQSNQANAFADQAQGFTQQAQLAAQNALNSEQGALESATAALGSAQAAENFASDALASANSASGSASSAANSASNAFASANSSGLSDAAAQAAQTGAAAAAEVAESFAASALISKDAALLSEQHAALSLSQAQAIKDFLQAGGLVFDSLASANSALLNSPTYIEGQVVLILSDSDYNGAKTYRVLIERDELSLDFDFSQSNYQLGVPDDYLAFSAYVSPQIVAKPTAANSFGFFGALSMDSGKLYFHDGNQWFQLTGGAV